MPSTEEYFSGKFEKCPNPDCGNTHAGDGIHRCNDCGKIFCLDCGSPFTLSLFSEACPNCNGDSSYIGEIKQKTCDVADVDSSDEDSDDDSSTPDYTPSEYIAPISSDYIPPSPVKKDEPGSGLWVLVVLALFLGWGFYLNKTDEPQKVATSSTVSVAKEPTFNTPGKADESDNENTTHVVSVLPLVLLQSASLPPGVSGVVLDARHDFPIPGEQGLGARIFVGLDDQKSFSITSHHDMDLERGDWVHIVRRDDGRVEVIKLGDSPEALGISPNTKSEDTIVDAPSLPPGVDGIVLDIEHDYPIAGRQELGAHIFVELSSGENVFITLFHDINLERKDKVRVATQDDGSVEVVKLPTE